MLRCCESTSLTSSRENNQADRIQTTAKQVLNVLYHPQRVDISRDQVLPTSNSLHAELLHAGSIPPPYDQRQLSEP